MLKKYKVSLLVVALIASIFSLTFLIITYPPDGQIRVGFFALSPLYFFFPLIFIFLFSLFTLIFKRPVFGALVACLVSVYLLFRLGGLTHPFFLFLLLALFITVLLLLRKER